MRAALLALALLAAPALAAPFPALPDALAPLQYGLALIHAPEAWALATGEGVRLAVIDSGLDLAHLDLLPRTATLDGASVAQPVGAYADLPAGPWLTLQDTRGHGTLVAGIAAAERGNLAGIAGVSRATLLPIKVWDLGAPATGDTIAAGIGAALDRGARVLQVSLVVPSLSPALAAALARAEAEGAVVVAAAGNDGATGPLWPAAAPTVLGVGAVDAQRAPWAMTNRFGADLAAPGVAVWSTALGNGYDHADGTSLAAPHVAGVAALVLDACPALAAAEVRALLLATAEDVGPAGYDAATGWGLVRADRAVAAALAACP